MGKTAFSTYPTESVLAMFVTSTMRLTEERHLMTAVAGMGAWSGRGCLLELGPGALRCVRGHIGVAVERRTVV
jgi:hypothetical protein